jgi:YVTN family beta-propeller protein
MRWKTQGLWVVLGIVLGTLSGRSALPGAGDVPSNVAYVSNEQGGVSVIDLERLEVVREVPVGGANPRGIVVTADGRYVLTANKQTADVSVLDTRTWTVVTRIPIGTNPEFLKLHPGGQWVYTSHEPGAEGGPPKPAGDHEEPGDKDEPGPAALPPSRIVAIEVGGWKVGRAFLGGVETEGIAFSIDGRRLIVTNEGEDAVSMYDVETGRLLRRTDLSPYGIRPRGLKPSPDGRFYVVTMEASSTLIVLDADLEVLRTRPTGRGPYGVAFDRSGERLFVAAARDQKLQVYDARTLEIQREIPVGARCWHFTFTPDDTKILVACGRSDAVYVIDAGNYQVVKVLKGFHLPWGIVTYPKAYGSLDLP